MFGRMNLADCQAIFILGGTAFVASALASPQIAPQIAPQGAVKEEISQGERAGSVDAPRMNGEPTARLESQQV